MEQVRCGGWGLALSTRSSCACKQSYNNNLRAGRRRRSGCERQHPKGTLEFVAVCSVPFGGGQGVARFCAETADGEATLDCVADFASTTDFYTASPHFGVGRIEDAGTLVVCDGVIDSIDPGLWAGLVHKLVGKGWTPIVDSSGGVIVPPGGVVEPGIDSAIDAMTPDELDELLWLGPGGNTP
jgi:hypothetical protein